MNAQTARRPPDATQAPGVRPCPACGRDNGAEPDSRYSQPPWSVKECRCGLTYLQASVAYEDLATTRAWERTSKEWSTARATMRPVLSRFSRMARPVRRALRFGRKRSIAEWVERFVPAGAVLDVGCAGAVHLEDLGPAYVPHGIEISQQLGREANRRLEVRGGRVWIMPAIDALREIESASISCVVMRSYLEHETFPAAVLREVARCLEPGGAVIIKVPDFGSLNRRVLGSYWCGFRFPDHLNYFTFSSLRDMARPHGLLPIHRNPLGRLRLGDNLWAVLAKAR